MPLLNIDLMTPDGVLFEGNEIPDDMQSAELVSRLVNTLGLPRMTAGGVLINYSLEIVNQGVRLQGRQTLGDAGATNGDVIRLLSSHKIQKPSELKPPTPVVTNNPSPDRAHTASARNGTLLVIPISDPNASVSKILGRLKDSLGVRPEDVSVLNPPTSNLKVPVSAAQHPSQQSVLGKYRTAMLGVMAVLSCLFLLLIISSKNKTESIAQAQEDSSAPTSIPSPTPVSVEPTPEPIPEPIRESLSQESSTPERQTVKVLRSRKTAQPKPPPVIVAQPSPINLPEVRKSDSLISAQNVTGKMPAKLETTPMIVAQAEPAETPPPPKKCGMMRKMFVGCKDKQPKKSKNGGAAGVAQTAAEAKAKASIYRGIGKTLP